MSSQNNHSRLSLNKISNFILGEQSTDIKAYTVGHLNENHLYKTTQVKLHRPWKTALKQTDSNKTDSENDSLFNKKEFQLSFSNQSSTYFLTQRKKSPATSSNNSSKMGVDFNMLKLPLLNKAVENKKSINRPLSHLLQSEVLNTESEIDLNLAFTDKEIAMNFLNGPFNGGSKEERFKNLVKFEKNVLQKSDMNVTNALHSTNGINLLEKKLEQELAKLDANNNFGSKFQFDVYRLDVFNSVFDQIISDSKQFGPLLNRIKTEYDDYLFFLLRNQQLAKQKQNNSITDLAEARLEYSKQCFRINTLDLEINTLGEMIVSLGDNNKVVETNIQQENEYAQRASAVIKEQARKELSDSTKSSEQDEAQKNLSEQLEKNRISILSKIDQIQINQKLKKDYVPVSVINNLTESVKEVEGETNKLKQQNQFLEKEEIESKKELKRLLFEFDRTEFADENISFLLKMIKSLDVVLSNSSSSLLENQNIFENLFHETSTQSSTVKIEDETVKNSYDDYFS